MPEVEVNLADHLFLFRTIGVIGFFIYVAGFYCLCTGRLGSATPPYFCLVLVASTCVLISLTVDFNISAALIQVFYIVMSFGGILLRWRSWRSNRPHGSAAATSPVPPMHPTNAPDPVFKSTRPCVTGLPSPGSQTIAGAGAAGASHAPHLQSLAVAGIQTDATPQDMSPARGTFNLNAVPA